MSEELFLILSVHRTEERLSEPNAPADRLCVWWRENANGYTTQLAEAGRYTVAGVKIHADPPHHVAIPLAAITVPASMGKALVRKALQHGVGKISKVRLRAMRYAELAEDIAAIFEEAAHLSRRPGWASVLDWASIRGRRPAGMKGRLPREAQPRALHLSAPEPITVPPAPESATHVRRQRVPVAPPVSLVLVVRTLPEILAASQVSGPVPAVTRLPCTVCGGVLELREGNRWPLHLRAPGGCGVGAVRAAGG